MDRVDAIDWLVTLVYFGLLPGVVLPPETRRQQQTSTDYFLTCRNGRLLAVGASIFVSKIGPEHSIGLAGQCARGKRRSRIADFDFPYFSGFLLLLLISITTILAVCCRAAAPRPEQLQ